MRYAMRSLWLLALYLPFSPSGAEASAWSPSQELRGYCRTASRAKGWLCNSANQTLTAQQSLQKLRQLGLLLRNPKASIAAHQAGLYAMALLLAKRPLSSRGQRAVPRLLLRRYFSHPRPLQTRRAALLSMAWLLFHLPSPKLRIFLLSTVQQWPVRCKACRACDAALKRHKSPAGRRREQNQSRDCRRCRQQASCQAIEKKLGGTERDLRRFGKQIATKIMQFPATTKAILRGGAKAWRPSQPRLKRLRSILAMKLHWKVSVLALGILSYVAQTSLELLEIAQLLSPSSKNKVQKLLKARLHELYRLLCSVQSQRDSRVKFASDGILRSLTKKGCGRWYRPQPKKR